MAGIIKRIMRHFNGADWDKYYPETSADQVKFTKADGTETDIQKELSGVNSTLDSEQYKYHIYVSMFTTGLSLNTDYEIEKPSFFKSQGITKYMLVAVHVSNSAGTSEQPLSTFYDINYIGKLKTAQGIYQLTNGACINKTARAIWVWWR